MRFENPRTAVGLALPPLLLAFAAGGCADPSAQARDAAIDQARLTVAGSQAALAFQLQQPMASTEGEDGFRDRIRASLEAKTQPAGVGRAWELTIGPGRRVVARMVYFGHGEAGGGWTKESYNVRLCALLSGTPGPAAEVTADTLQCPGDLQSDSAMIGTINETVPLSD